MRSLYQGPRAAIAFSILLTIIAAIFLLVAPAGARLEAMFGIGQVAVLFIAVLGLIYSVRIRVEKDGISVLRGFWSRRTVHFTDISHSVPKILAEPNHPLWLDIYGQGSAPLLRVPLKSLRQRDVDWIMSLEKLRVRA